MTDAEDVLSVSLTYRHRGGMMKQKLQWIRVTWSLAHTAVNDSTEKHAAYDIHTHYFSSLL